MSVCASQEAGLRHAEGCWEAASSVRITLRWFPSTPREAARELTGVVVRSSLALPQLGNPRLGEVNPSGATPLTRIIRAHRTHRTC